jgi:hypothetical protein
LEIFGQIKRVATVDDSSAMAFSKPLRLHSVAAFVLSALCVAVILDRFSSYADQSELSLSQLDGVCLWRPCILCLAMKEKNINGLI